MFGNHPLNAEITMQKESEKFSAIKVIWGSIFALIGLVARFLLKSHNLDSLD